MYIHFSQKKITPLVECIKLITNQLLTTMFAELLRCPLEEEGRSSVHKSAADEAVSQVECPVQYLCYYIGIGVDACFVPCRFKRQPTKCHDGARMYMLSTQMSW
jgi:hypothetical protein